MNPVALVLFLMALALSYSLLFTVLGLALF